MRRELGRLEAALSQGSTGFISGLMEERNLARKLLGLNIMTLRCPFRVLWHIFGVHSEFWALFSWVT